MIITVTLNPAIDQTLVVPKFVAGDTIRVKSSRFDPGGKGINVSRVVRELGGESIAMGFAPGGLGRYLEQTLETQGIDTDFVHTRGETRTNITIMDESRHVHTILSDPGPTIDKDSVQTLRRRIKRRLRPGDWLVLAGSIPPPLTGAIYAELIREATEIGAHTVLDADNLAMKTGAEAHPEVVKGNRREVERLVGRHLDDEPSTLSAADEIQQSGVSTVIITRGREGAVVNTDGRCLRGVAPRVRAVSAVGSGDALLAGIVLTLSRGGTMDEAVRLGIAAGTATVLVQGTEMCRRREVDILLPRVRVQEIAVGVPAPARA
jgi:1-phosphofructokinase